MLGVVALSLGASDLAHARTVLCRWGPKAKLAPIPGCGVPRQLQVAIPEGAWKLYFAVNENPGLSGYNHRAKGTAGALRPFKRKINLLGSELFLCPADFKKERVLAFQLVSRKRVLVDRPTCRLGPPSETSKTPGTGQGATQAGGREKSGAGKTKTDGGSAQTGTGGGQGSGSVSKPLIQKGGGDAAWRKIDRTARALAITALVFSLLALVAVGLGIRFFRKRCDEAVTKASRETNSSDAES